HYFSEKSINGARAPELDQLDAAFLTRLEADRGTCRNIRAAAIGAVAVELQRFVGFKKMVVGPDLNRPVSAVDHRDRDGPAADVELDGSRLRSDFAWNHFSLEGASRNRIVDGDQFGPVRESRLDLDVGDHLRHALHDLVAPEQGPAVT